MRNLKTGGSARTRMRRTQYVYLVTVTKACEGGIGTSFPIQLLKGKGIKARSNSSPYVGEVNIEVEKGKMTRARKILRPYISWV